LLGVEMLDVWLVPGRKDKVAIVGDKVAVRKDKVAVMGDKVAVRKDKVAVRCSMSGRCLFQSAESHKMVDVWSVPGVQGYLAHKKLPHPLRVTRWSVPGVGMSVRGGVYEPVPDC